MIGFWKSKNTDVEAGQTESEAVKGESFGLSESARVELINQAQLLPVSPGQVLADELAQKQLMGTELMLLVQTGALRLDVSENAASVEVKAGQVLACDKGGCPFLSRLHVERPVSLLCLTAPALGQLRESTQLSLLRQSRLLAAELNAALYSAVDTAEARYQQLADVLFKSMETGEVQFAESEAVTQVVRRIPRLPLASVELLHRLMDE